MEEKINKVTMKIIKFKSILNQNNLSVQILHNKILIMMKRIIILRKSPKKGVNLKSQSRKDKKTNKINKSIQNFKQRL
jgi:hypothetical protein